MSKKRFRPLGSAILHFIISTFSILDQRTSIYTLTHTRTPTLTVRYYGICPLTLSATAKSTMSEPSNRPFCKALLRCARKNDLSPVWISSEIFWDLQIYSDFAYKVLQKPSEPSNRHFCNAFLQCGRKKGFSPVWIVSKNFLDVQIPRRKYFRSPLNPQNDIFVMPFSSVKCFKNILKLSDFSSKVPQKPSEPSKPHFCNAFLQCGPNKVFLRCEFFQKPSETCRFLVESTSEALWTLKMTFL